MKIEVLVLQLIQVLHDLAAYLTKVQAFANRIPMKCKMQSVFCKSHLSFLFSFV